MPLATQLLDCCSTYFCLFVVTSAVAQPTNAQIGSLPLTLTSSTHGESNAGPYTIGHNVLFDNGEFVYTKELISIPGVSASDGPVMDLNLNLVYRSKTVFDGPYGQRWDLSLCKRVVETGSQLAFYPGNGCCELFTGFDSATSSWTIAPPSYFGRFSKNLQSTSARYMYEQRDGTRLELDYQGRATRLADRWGNAILFAYDLAQQPYLLTRITDTTQRQVQLTYNSAHRLEAVQDYAGRNVTLDYTPSGDLSIVRLPPALDGSPTGQLTSDWTYGYTGTHLFEKAWTPLGDLVLTNVYYTSGTSAGRVQSQTLGALNWFLEYDTSGAAARETASDGRRRVFKSAAAGTPTPTSLWEFTGLFAIGDPDSSPATPKLRSSDPQAFITVFEHDSNLLCTKVRYPGGNSRRVTYDAHGKTIVIRHKADDSLPDNAISDVLWEYVYDSNHYDVLRTKTRPDATSVSYFYDFDEASLGDLNGDSIVGGTAGSMVRMVLPIATQADGTLQAPAIHQYQHNQFGQLIREVDPTSVVTNYLYYSTTDPAAGSLKYFLSNITIDPASNGLQLTTQYQYDTLGRQTARVDQKLNVLRTTYNNRGQITEVIPPMAAYKIRYEHDLADRMIAMHTRNVFNGTVDPNEWFTTQYVRGSLGSILSVVQERDASQNSVWTYTYSPRMQLSSTTDPAGVVETQEYDERGLLWKHTVAPGSSLADTTSFSYDSNGNLVRSLDGDGHEWIQHYDAFGRFTGETDPVGNNTTISLDKLGRVVQEVKTEAQSGVVVEKTLQTFDQRGRLTRQRRDALDGSPLAEWQYYYDLAGRSVRDRNSRGFDTTHSYDAAGRFVGDTDPSGNSTTFTLDPNGNTLQVVTTQNLPSGPIVYREVSTYDSLDRLVSSTTAGATEVQLPAEVREYDSLNRVRVLTRPNGLQDRRTYDGLDNLVTLSRDSTLNGVATSIETNYVRDAAGRVLEYLDERDEMIIYEYDAAGRLWQIRSGDPEAPMTTITYDRRGNVESIQEPNGRLVTCSYDSVGRLMERRYTSTAPIPGTTKETYQWDALSRLVGAATYEGVAGDVSVTGITRVYDGMSRLRMETTTIANAQPLTIQMDYDSQSGLQALVYPSGWELSIERDGLDRLVSVYDGARPIASESYHGRSRLEGRVYFNGVQARPTYDEFGRLGRLQYQSTPSQTVYDRTYSYAAGGPGGCTCAGTIAWISDALTNKYDVFEYDGDQRLTRARLSATDSSGAGALKSFEYTYSTSVGDRSSSNSNGSLLHYCLTGGGTYRRVAQAVPNCQTSVSNMRYDARGNLTHDGSRTPNVDYLYDVRGRLMQANVAGIPRVVYHYDALGRRVLREDLSSGARRRFVFFRENVIEEREGLTELLAARHAYGEDGADDRIFTACWPVPGQGAVVEYAPLVDHLGTVTLLTGNLGTIVERYEYSPFGEPTIRAVDNSVLTESAYGNTNMFTGREWEAAIRVYNYRARAYDPRLGRFLQRDPAGFADSPNAYEYVRSNPINNSDPSGLTTVVQGPTVSSKEIGKCAREVTKRIYFDRSKSAGKDCSGTQITAAIEKYKSAFKNSWGSITCPCKMGEKDGRPNGKKGCTVTTKLEEDKEPSRNSTSVIFWCGKDKPLDGSKPVDGSTNDQQSDIHISGSSNLNAHEQGHSWDISEGSDSGLADDYDRSTGKPKPDHEGHLMAQVNPDSSGPQTPHVHEACTVVQSMGGCPNCCGKGVTLYSWIPDHDHPPVDPTPKGPPTEDGGGKKKKGPGTPKDTSFPGPPSGPFKRGPETGLVAIVIDEMNAGPYVGLPTLPWGWWWFEVIPAQQICCEEEAVPHDH